MSLYSKQKFYCRGCGIEMNVHINSLYTRRATVCGNECGREVYWKETLSIIGSEYKTRDKTKETNY
jgi:hypothetical protein